MCDYSLQNVQSRSAKVGDKLVTANFGTGTTGFAAIDDPNTAVCILPGTELAFDGEVRKSDSHRVGAGVTTARFRQVDKDTPHTHHDALEFAGGHVHKLNDLRVGQRATVLQLPVDPNSLPKGQREAAIEAQRRVEYIG